MSGTRVFIPELWEDKPEIDLNNYAQKSELNNFILKNTNINMNDHTIENVKVGNTNDAVNKSYVDNQISTVNNLINSINTLISTVQSKIPYMSFIKETVTGSNTGVKTIQKSVEDPVFIGLKPENVLLIPKFEYTTNEGPLILNAKVISINNNTLTFNIKIENRYKQGWEISVVVYVYIIIVHQKSTLSMIQNDEPSDRTHNELPGPTQLKSTNFSNSYF